MKYLILVVLILLAFSYSSSSFASDEWRDADTWREGVWQGLNFLDDVQTEEIARNPQKWSEVGTAKNFIGAHPSVEQVRVYFAASALVHYYIAQTLDHGWRDAFQYATIYVEYDVTSRNVQIHGGLKYPF